MTDAELDGSCHRISNCHWRVMTFPGNVTALTFVLSMILSGESGTRVSGSRTWKRSILQRFASQRKPAFGGEYSAAGFSAPAQQENLMMSGSQCRRFSGGRRELRQRGHRATSRKFLLFTEV
ncbi:hypothetical protein [Bradyrhizobium sp. RDI18]|uniref:hypothetical protein n=1 Tax=Bradyrhizobium sp. RDI18 TaxID=3367400 RepID=UPI00372470CC